MSQGDPASSNSLAEYRTELAVDRTAMAAGRSLMAWVRTGLSLNGFGFTIYKFIETAAPSSHPDAARNIGLFVIALGILSIILGCMDYVRVSRWIRSKYGITMLRFPLIIAGLVGGLGTILFVIVTFRVF